MELSFDKQDNIGILGLSGNLIGEKDGLPISENFSGYLENGTSQFVIDLSDLQLINSTGLGVLITLLTKARKAGGEVVLANPTDYIQNLLLITKLNTIFQIFPSTEEAVASFQG
ncbi:MAG: STAS domain-containing protein [Bacteroidota bacterium]